MALPRSAWFVASCAALFAFGATTRASAEDTAAPEDVTFHEWRVGYMGAAAPSVKEEGGEKWATDARGWRAGVTWLASSIPVESDVATTYGAQLTIGKYDTSAPTGTGTVTLTQAMVDAYYGWQYGIFDSDGLHGFGELLPFVGVGANHLAVDTKNRIGPQFEAGIRTGAFLTQHNWLAGLTLAYVVGEGHVASPYTTVIFRENGFNFGFEFGHRF